MTRDDAEFLFPSALAESVSRIGVCKAMGCSEDEHRCGPNDDGEDAA